MFCSDLYFRDYKFNIVSTGITATYVTQSVELFYVWVICVSVKLLT